MTSQSISEITDCFATIDEEELTSERIDDGEGSASVSSISPRKKAASLFGRSSQTSLLLRSFHNVCGPTSKSKVISVHGASGIGKTALIRGSLRDAVVLSGRGFFVEGKFDQVVSNAPFTGVIEAISDLCDLLEQSTDFETVHKPRIQKRLEASPPQTNSIVSRLFQRPQLFGSELEDDSKSSFPMESKRVVADAFRVLLQALASPMKPCVFFLDDVQWANHGSIDVIEALATDPDSKNVLFVLAGRDNDPEQDVYEDLITRIQSTSTEVTDVRLGLLGAGSVHQMVCWELHLVPTDKSRALADVVVEKTFAKPLQVIQYIASLRAKGLLKLDSHRKWTFDVEKIKNETNVSDCVAAQVWSRLSLLDEQATTVLRIAAFLGFNFEVDTLAGVVDYSMKRRAHKGSGQNLEFCLDKSNVMSAVETCCIQHLVEPMFGKEGWFKFSHDSIQRSLYDSLGDGEDNATMHYYVGSCLSELENKASVFHVADHLNRALALVRDNGNARLLDLAKMNMEAASRSLESLDISSSSHYGNFALECLQLGQFGWTSGEQHRCLNLDVHLLLSRTSLHLGNYDRCHHFCSEIRVHGRCLSETKDSYITACWAFRGQNKPAEALDFCVKVLSELNVRVPRSPSWPQVVLKLIRVRRLLRRRFGSDAGSRYDILEWPESTDEKASCVARLLFYCGVIAHLADLNKFAVYVFLYVVEQGLKNKVFFADSSTYAFTLYGYVELLFGNVEVAYKYGELVSQMLKRRNACVDISRSLCVSNYYLLRSKHLMRECVEPCYQAYEMALTAGDVDGASFMLRGHIFCAMYSDTNLVHLNKRVRRDCLRIIQDYKQENFYQWFSVLWQALLCLIGETESPTTLTGDVTNEEEALTTAREANKNFLATFYCVKLDLVILFGAITRSEAIAYEYCKGATALHVVHYAARVAYFSAALAYVDFMRAGVGKGHLAPFFRKSLKLFRSWKSRRLVNETPYCLVLEAEAASLSLLKPRVSKLSLEARLNQVLMLYEEGIAAAKIAGCSRLEAQATERAGQMLVMADRLSEAKEYIDKASDLFLTWGAIAKVEQMRTKYGFLEKSLSPAPRTLHGLLIERA